MDTAKNRDLDSLNLKLNTQYSFNSLNEETESSQLEGSKAEIKDDSVKSSIALYSSCKRKDIHNNFCLLKQQLNHESFQRKTQIDSLLKKCKSKVFRTIHQALKNCLRVKLERLPQNFITNINIEFNKDCLNKTIYEIYNTHNLIGNIDNLLENKKVFEDKILLFKNFLSLTFKEIFEFYLSSKQYIKDFEYIKKREGEGFAILFNYVSKVFVPYFEKFKGNTCSLKKDPKATKENSSICNSEEGEDSVGKTGYNEDLKFSMLENN